MKHLKIKKTIFAMLASCFIATSAYADGVKIKVFCSYDDTFKEFNIDDIQKMKFDNDGVTFMFKDGIQPEEFFEYGDVGSMKFDGVSTSIDNVKSEKDGNIEIAYDGRTIKVSGCDAAQLRVFDIAGRPVISENIIGEASVSTDNLASGVYILRVNNKTFKFNKF